MTTDDPALLEEEGWRALSTDPQAATEFYGRILDDAVVHAAARGMRLDDRATIIESMAARRGILPLEDRTCCG